MKKEAEGKDFSLLLKDIVLMKMGGWPHCFTALSDSAMEVKTTREPIDKGYKQKKDDAKSIFVTLFVIYLILAILIVVYTIYKSMD